MAKNFSTLFFAQLFFIFPTTYSEVSTIAILVAAVCLEIVIPTIPVPDENYNTETFLNLWVFMITYLANTTFESHSFNPSKL